MATHKGPVSLRPRCTRGGSSVAAIPVYLHHSTLCLVAVSPVLCRSYGKSLRGLMNGKCISQRRQFNVLSATKFGVCISGAATSLSTYCMALVAIEQGAFAFGGVIGFAT
jgi:hypothetical protein